MPLDPDRTIDNIEFAAEELLRAPADQHKAMLEGIVKALTSRLLQGNPGIAIREVSDRVTKFVDAVQVHMEKLPYNP